MSLIMVKSVILIWQVGTGFGDHDSRELTLLSHYHLVVSLILKLDSVWDSLGSFAMYPSDVDGGCFRNS